MLTIRQAFKSYGADSAPRVLKGVDLHVPQGEFFTLLGPSGCGKTTLLRCVAGLEQLDMGRIQIDGLAVADATGVKRRSLPIEVRPIGMVFQSYAIWPHMTVFQNAAYPLKHGRHRPGRSAIPQLVEDMLEKVGLASYASRDATALSGGQQQRLALARALLGKPKLLLLDEPLSNLDANLRVMLRSELKQIQRETGVTTLYVTHDQAEALAMSDTVAVMNAGNVIQLGSPQDLYDAPANGFVAGFLGESTLVPGRVSASGHVETSLGVITAVATPPIGSSVLLCIRPEDVRPLDSSAFPSQPNSIDCRVRSAEFLGDHVGVVLEVGQAVLKAKFHRSQAVAPGNRLVVHCEPARVHVMDREDDSDTSGTVIRDEIAAATDGDLTVSGLG